MPSKNLEKIYAIDTYYHIYNRGVEQRIIFQDQQDYIVFLGLFKRYLSKEPETDAIGREYPNYHDKIELLAYCLMPNHFHLLVYQRDKDAMTRFMRSLCTTYTMYFNKKYKRVGRLFQNRFKASIIIEDSYLLHISRYIHLNPDDYRRWQFSSLPHYLGRRRAEWLNPQPILDLFNSESYLDFLDDYIDHREMLKELKSALADA